MFKLVNSLTCWWPVKVQEPDPSKPGKMKDNTFEIEFEIIDRDEARAGDKARRAILDRMNPDLTDAEIEALQVELDEHDSLAFHRVIRNWRQITDETNLAFAFSAENLTAVLKHDRVRAAILRAYNEAIGNDKARLGN